MIEKETHTLFRQIFQFVLMGQNPSRGVNSSSADQNTHYLSQNPKTNYHVYKNPLLDPILCQLNSVHILISLIFTSYYLPKQCLPFRFSSWNSGCISDLYIHHNCLANLNISSSSSNNNNNNDDDDDNNYNKKDDNNNDLLKYNGTPYKCNSFPHCYMLFFLNTPGSSSMLQTELVILW
jgi:hypothetical protein